jgi:hypothetical protein
MGHLLAFGIALAVAAALLAGAWAFLDWRAGRPWW